MTALFHHIYTCCVSLCWICIRRVETEWPKRKKKHTVSDFLALPMCVCRSKIQWFCLCTFTTLVLLMSEFVSNGKLEAAEAVCILTVPTDNKQTWVAAAISVCQIKETQLLTALNALCHRCNKSLPPVCSDNSPNQGKNWALTSLIIYEWLPSVSNVSKSHIGGTPNSVNPAAWFSHVLPPTHLYINH